MLKPLSSYCHSISLKVFTILCFLSFSADFAFSSVEKVRVCWSGDASSTASLLWTFDGSTQVYMDTIDHGTTVADYTNQYAPTETYNYMGMETAVLRLAGLSPNTHYYFVITDGSGFSNRLYFQTAPADPNHRLSIIAGGDSRNNREVRRWTNKIVAKLRPDAVAFGGDLTLLALSFQYAEWLDDWQHTISSDGRCTPIICTRGNHENDDEEVEKLFDTPDHVYFKTYLGGDLLSLYTLNTNISIAGNQTQWLDSTLQEDQGQWKVAQYHRPMRPHTANKGDGVEQYANWAGLFYDYHVQCVIECDAHTVKQTYRLKPDTNADNGFLRDPSGTMYIGEGCWGAPLRENDDTKSWTKASGMFNQIKWIWVDQGSMEVRTIQVENPDNIEELPAGEQFRIPKNLLIWNPLFEYEQSITSTTYNQPEVTDFTPTHNGFIPESTATTFHAEALGDYAIQRIELFIDDSLAHTEYSDIMDVDLTLPRGVYQVKVRAIDQNNAYSKEEIHVVIVGNFSEVSTTPVRTFNDDAEEGEDNQVNWGSSDLEFVNDETLIFGPGDQTIGIRFDRVKIPSNAIIDSAFIQFTTNETNNDGTELYIYGEDTTYSWAFREVDYEISHRKKTTSVFWDVEPWNNNNESGLKQRTPNIGHLVQSMIQNNWRYDGPLTFIVDGSGKRVAHSFDGDADKAPKLVIYYSMQEPPTGSAEIVDVEKNVSIYPIPANNYLQFKWNQNEMTPWNLIITDIQGKILDNQMFLDNQARIDVSKYKAGTYVAILRRNGFVLRKKVFITK